ncbi:polynucleotide adenylyltransferase PcnB [Neisseriaceae bacterium ESL0693]|nr:polynucleotide adenylyltransferase PcnB [Neisseriaceae bacterium ESL0693]
MLKKWLKKVLPRKAADTSKQCVLPFSEHRIKPEKLSFAAEKVIKRLQNADFQAYVVGGAVRDLLLGVTPKDFDVATNATPEQVRKLFRRSRIIGRRFPIVHVMVGPETIEVTTFRGGELHCQNELGRIMKDTSFGTLVQDAMRRDFTANALYYDPFKQQVLDYHHGVEDIRARRLVMIGEPLARYQEDPVRMLRAVRLSGKLGFSVEAATAEPIMQCAPLLQREPSARLFDEILKILFCGHASACLHQLRDLGLAGAHPLLDALMPAMATEQNIVALTLHNTDERLRQDKSVSVGFVLAAVLWPRVQKAWQQYLDSGMSASGAMNTAIADERTHLDKSWGIPQRYTVMMREIWTLQPQFEARRGARPFRLVTQKRFRAAFDFLCLRAQLGEVQQEKAEWWQQFQQATEAERQKMIHRVPASESLASTRKRRRKPKAKDSTHEKTS